MNFFYPIKIAISNLLAAKFRSFLTILGIIIGVASVVIIMAVGASAQQLILDQVEGIGSNLIGVMPGASDEKGPPAQALGIKITSFKYKDYLALMDKNNVPQIEAGAAYIQGNATVSYRDKEKSLTIIGITHQYPQVQDAEISQGRFFFSAEDINLSKSAVIGSKVKTDYFGSVNSVGKKIKIGKEYFTIVGELKEKGSSGFGTASQDDTVFVPLETAQKELLGADYLAFARFKVRNAAELELAKTNMQKTMRAAHDINDPQNDDFTVRDMAAAIDTITNITNILKYFLALIAAISLLVGGIGIMNIMLISVNERIREIGLRKALGAKSRHIVQQFLVESITVTLSGGVIGIIIGIIISFLVSIVAGLLQYEWPFIINLSSIFLAISVSILVGLVFGTYPSRKASKVSPMEALRYE